MKNRKVFFSVATLLFVTCVGVGWAQPAVYLDIKPGSDLNPLNVGSAGWLVVTVLGTEAFDVTTIDPESLSLEGLEPNFGPPGPRILLDDVSGPGGEPEGGCAVNISGPDGYLDLVMRFEIQEVVELLDLDSYEAGNVYVLELTGELLDGTTFSASDCVMPIKVVSTSNSSGGNQGGNSGGYKGPH